MFGYVTVAKNQLTGEEYEIFRSYYCGICRATGKAASQMSRMGLSYDITFLAIVLSALSKGDIAEISGRCIPHPIRKRAYREADPVLMYCAASGVILEYLKLADDWHDERSIKAALGMLALRRGYKKARRRCEDVYNVINYRLGRLSALENDNCAVIDEAAEEFAKITEALFTPDFIEDNAQRRALSWFGYNLGRWIYIIDAYNDYDEDLRSGAYNPLIAAGGAVNEKTIELSLVLTLNNIASAFELIDFKRNRDLIGKMVYISLKEKQNSILNKDVDK